MSEDERAATTAEIGRLRERVQELLLANNQLVADVRAERRERQRLAGLILQGSGPPMPIRTERAKGSTLAEMRQHAMQGSLYQLGDMKLFWVNEGDLDMVSVVLVQQARAASPAGCICPPGAERGCRGLGCPRATFIPRGLT